MGHAYVCDIHNEIIPKDTKYVMLSTMDDQGYLSYRTICDGCIMQHDFVKELAAAFNRNQKSGRLELQWMTA